MSKKKCIIEYDGYLNKKHMRYMADSDNAIVFDSIKKAKVVAKQLRMCGHTRVRIVKVK